jgi:hypothetical protein
MKQRPPLAKTKSHFRSKADQTFHSHVSTEQEASTGSSGVWLWLVTALLLTGLVMGWVSFTRFTGSKSQILSYRPSAPQGRKWAGSALCSAFDNLIGC